jgi:hypothetical protein
MVAVSIGENGVEFDPLVNVRVHAAAELFPLLQGEQFTELVNDIREHGLREPIVFTPDGQLLDGRNRYRACKKIRDEEPTRRTEHSEPWAYVISTNVHRRHLSESQRAMIAARIAERHRGEYARAKQPIGGDAYPAQLPPSQKEAAALLNVGTTSIGRARKVVQHGIKGLQLAVESGVVPVYTAARVASEMQPDEQENWVRRVNNGANPKKIAPPDVEQKERATRDPRPARPNNSPNRHRCISAHQIGTLINALDSMNLVLDTAPDGLDPSLTDEEAAQLVDGLSKGSGAYRRLLALLKQQLKENAA